MTRGALILLLAIGAPQGLFAQQYRLPTDTVHYNSENSYLMYFVRGADTLGQPVTTHTRESQVAVSGARLSVTLRSLDGGSFRRVDTYDVSPAGRVLAVNGTPTAEAPDTRVDLFPRLPDPPVTLEPGRSWVDTVGVSDTRSYGATYYRVHRTYTVARIIDSLGTQVAVLAARGTMRLRQGGWQDSTRGIVWWQEVSGPVADTAWFDTRNGLLVGDFSIMDLSGQGGVGPKGAKGAMPSGLRSSVRRTRVTH